MLITVIITIIINSSSGGSYFTTVLIWLNKRRYRLKYWPHYCIWNMQSVLQSGWLLICCLFSTNNSLCQSS